MTIQIQQIVMARRLLRLEGGLNAAMSAIPIDDSKRRDQVLGDLRSEAREEYWLHSTKSQRDLLRYSAVMLHSPDVQRLVDIIKSHWSQEWNNGRYDVDFFYHYLADKTAAELVWELVDVDLFVVTDCNRRVVFASLENATGLVFDDGLAQKLANTVDMYSYFTPLPLPESRRHVLDRYVRRLHPELDPANATVEQLHRAKMAVVHYGRWAMQGDPHGKRVVPTRDTCFNRSGDPPYNQMDVFPGFCRSVLGRCGDVVRFLLRNLDPELYSLYHSVYDNLPGQHRLDTTDDDFLSLFAVGINGYTQRHRDTNDLAGGMAGLVTLGSYTGGNLCIPQLGFRVRYAPGACAILRGDKMDHLVTDYSGPRYFVIGTHHESMRRHAMRKLREMEAARQQQAHRESEEKKDEEQEEQATGSAPSRPPQNPDPFAPADCRAHDETAPDDGLAAGVFVETPCVNPGCDDDDEEVANRKWTNEELHEAGALPMYDDSNSDSSRS
ncbi:hypothetical protein PG997_013567 [Apiospora hydei]|uniref:2OGFeDO JBP1/TET oxygenase domain-containing protein n=1 Tax=Apiospora hydei TaxID=1337664 RepID=A0ABR1V6J0_9PEZI